MKKKSLKNRILIYLLNRPNQKFNGGFFERMALNVGYKASNASRRCRELENEERIKSEIINGSVWYWYSPPPKGRVIEVEGQAIYQPPKQESLI